MRQLFHWRLFAALGALVLLALGVDQAFGVTAPTGSLAASGPVGNGSDGEPMRRRVDLIAPAERIERSLNFNVTEAGVTEGFLDAVLGPGRVMRVAPGTPGVVECANLRSEDRCVVFADLLGDAVVWFALMPRGPNDTVRLPPIVDLEDGYAIFENGWEITYPPVIERDEDTCGADIVSFSDFLRRFGPNSTSVVDLETMEVTEVICGEEFIPPPTTVVVEGSPSGSFVPATTTPAVLGAPVTTLSGTGLTGDG
ncbi:MAG: hypothetical protein AB8G26_17640 [Ilumatobacter sp.]